jgi:hypothetical protein
MYTCAFNAKPERAIEERIKPIERKYLLSG